MTFRSNFLSWCFQWWHIQGSNTPSPSYNVFKKWSINDRSLSFEARYNWWMVHQLLWIPSIHLSAKVKVFFFSHSGQWIWFKTFNLLSVWKTQEKIIVSNLSKLCFKILSQYIADLCMHSYALVINLGLNNSAIFISNFHLYICLTCFVMVVALRCSTTGCRMCLVKWRSLVPISLSPSLRSQKNLKLKNALWWLNFASKLIFLGTHIIDDNAMISI